MPELDIEKHRFLPLYGELEVPFRNTEFEAQPTEYSTDFKGGKLDKKPYIMPFEVENPELIVVIYPGGGYFACSNHHSTLVAAELNKYNITAFVVCYRTGDRGDPDSSYGYEAIIQDGIRGMQYARAYAIEHGFEDRKVIALGFSAGGHLALSLSLGLSEYNTLYDKVGQLSSVPDGVIVGYPCTTFKDGAYPTLSPIFSARSSPEEREKLNERFTLMPHVDQNTPPTFIYYGRADSAVPPEKNCIPYFFALQRAGVESILLGYENIGHGVGLAKGTCAEGWLEAAMAWMRKVCLK